MMCVDWQRPWRHTAQDRGCRGKAATTVKRALEQRHNGAERSIILGMTGGQLLSVAYTERGTNIRIMTDRVFTGYVPVAPGHGCMLLITMGATFSRVSFPTATLVSGR